MKANVGTIDRAIRILVGLGLIGATLGGLIGMWGWLGIVLVATGLFSFCPAYLPLGISSCSTKK